MTKEQHQKEVAKLKTIEKELIDLIAESLNPRLANKFDEWGFNEDMDD